MPTESNVRSASSSSLAARCAWMAPVAVLCVGAALTLPFATAANAEPSITDLESQVEEASAELEIIVEDYNRVREELKTLEEHHEELDGSLSPLRNEVSASADEVGDLAVSLYQAGPAASFAPLLSGTPETMADRLSILEFLGTSRNDQVSELAEATRILESEETQISELSAEYEDLKSEKLDKESLIADAMSNLDTVSSDAYALGYTGSPNLEAPPVPGGDAGSAAVAVQFVNDQLGAPYQWGGSGPGYDCSGLTSSAWSAAGVNLPHNSAEQFNSVARVSRDQLMPGDLVFYYDDLHHVGMYVGDDKIIHAPTEGQTVRVSPIDESPVAGFGRPN